MAGFRSYQPVGLRVWHGFNAVIVSGLLLTVLLRRTLFGIRANAELIQARAMDAGVTLDAKTARKISETLTDHFWQWHIYLGYALTVIFLARILVGFIHKHSPMTLAWTGVKDYRAAPPSRKRAPLHYALVRATYLTFYAAVLFMVLSGLAMVFQDEWHVSNELAENLHAVHEWFQWYFLVFVVAHIGGVIFAEFGRYKGLVSDMIHGGERGR